MPESSEKPLHFNPRSPWGERLNSMYKFVNAVKFQSTLPVGGATAARLHILSL